MPSGQTLILGINPVPAAATPSIHWFELLIESMPSAILVVDLSHQISLVNRSLEVLFGYSRRELIGQPIEMLLPERFKSHHPGYVDAFVAAPSARAMGAGRDLFGRHKDGHEIPLEIGLNPIETPSGQVVLASIIDISERKRAEAVQLQMKAFVESADDAIIIKGLDGIIRSWNPAAERLLGYRPEEMIGQPTTRLMPDDRVHEETMIIERLRNGQRVSHFETVRRRKDGSLLNVSLTISPIRDASGRVVAASKVMRDITAHKRIEDNLRRSNAELQEANKDLDDFVYMASHDLRAPLNGVRTLAQWVVSDDGSLSAESRERLLLIQRRIERMQRLLDDTRDYARAGRSADTSGTILSAAELVRDVAAAFQIPEGFAVRADPSLAKIRVYRVPLEQVLHNLIDNAVKHHDRPNGLVTVSVEPRESCLRFSVIDDGPGVPQEYRESVFAMFSQLKPRDTVEGSGMGLALVRKIVRKVGGDCGITGNEGRGAHFWFDWPCVA
jgi:PAS domain S-box-containing protein